MLDCIDLRLGISCTLNEWRFYFRSHYEALRPFLSPTGRQASSWCCPVNGRKQELIAEQGGYKAISNDCQSYPCVESNSVRAEDLELWKFCPSIFAHRLSPGLGLHADPKLLKHGVLRLGSLACRSTRLPAFLLNCDAAGYQAHAQIILDKQTDRCLFFTTRYCPDTAEWLRQMRHGYFSLEELLFPGSLDPSPTYWQELQKFKSSLSTIPYRPDLAVLIAPGFKRITYPDGYVLNLAKAHKRRAVVRFIHEQVRQLGTAEFDVEIMREDYNRQHPDKPWNSDRFKEDLFKDAAKDFERIFETIDAALGKYRLKL